jgi:hypothetical protein
MAVSNPLPAFNNLVWPPLDKEAISRRLLRVPALTQSALPAGWYNWIMETAFAQYTPPDFVASNLLATAAGSIGNARTVAPKIAFTQPSVLWIANVSPPSGGKTPAQYPFVRALAEVELRNRNIWAREVKQARAEHDSRTSEGPKRSVPKFEAPPAPRLVMVDITPEQVVRVMEANPRGLIGRYTELGLWLGSFGRYSAKADTGRTFYLMAYDAAPYVRDRVGDGKDKNRGGEHSTVPHAALSILGDITPDKLKPILEGDDDGLVARLIYIWPEPLPVAPMSLESDESFVIRHGQLVAMINRLRGLSLVEEGEPQRILLSRDALTLFIETKLKIDAQVGKLTGLYQGWLGKGDGRLLRLALVYEYLAWAASTPIGDLLGEPVKTFPEPKEISVGSLERALEYLRYATAMFERVMGGVEPTDTDTDAEKLIKLILAKGLTAFSLKDLHREPGFRWLRGEVRGRDASGKERRDNVINLLIDIGVLQTFWAGSPRGPIEKLAVRPDLAEYFR